MPPGRSTSARSARRRTAQVHARERQSRRGMANAPDVPWEEDSSSNAVNTLARVGRVRSPPAVPDKAEGTGIWSACWQVRLLLYLVLQSRAAQVLHFFVRGGTRAWHHWHCRNRHLRP